MKSWKKQLNSEFDLFVPKLNDSVKNAPIMAIESNSQASINNKAIKKQHLKFASIITAVMAVLVFGVLGIFGVFNPNLNSNKHVFAFEINPAIVFVTDENGVVESVKALNQDADTILSTEEELNKILNLPLNQAIVNYTDFATKLGYIDVTQTASAVRISYSDEKSNDILMQASNSLSSYFCDKGIYVAVVEDDISLQELASRAGVASINNFSDLVNSINNLSLCYGNRISDLASVEEIENTYNTSIIGNSFMELVKQQLSDNINNIVNNMEMLSSIVSTNTKIMLYEENFLHLDYWNLKKLNLTVVPDELINDIESQLQDYALNFNKEINSIEELLATIGFYSSFIGEDLVALLQSISSEQFIIEATNFVGMLKNIGIDVTSLESLLSVPTSIEEYNQKFSDIISILRDTRLETYLGVYGENRQVITPNDYIKFVQNIESEYGSLKNYWNNLQQN